MKHEQPELTLIRKNSLGHSVMINIVYKLSYLILSLFTFNGFQLFRRQMCKLMHGNSPLQSYTYLNISRTVTFGVAGLRLHNSTNTHFAKSDIIHKY